MHKKNMFMIQIVIISTLLCSRISYGITVSELAGICQSMESSFVDMTIDYEWFTVPPYTLEDPEVNNLAISGSLGFISEGGVETKKLQVSRLGNSWSRLNLSDQNMPLDYPFFAEEILKVKNARTQKKQVVVIKHSYDGIVSSKFQQDDILQSNGTVKTMVSGLITKQENINWQATPLAFSVLRPCLMPIWDYKPLSEILFDSEKFVVLDTKITKVNDFNTIMASFKDPCELTRNRLYMRIYFSVDHNYTPVKYEHMTGSVNKPEHVALTIEVQSLEKVEPNLWFPGSGLIVDPDNNSHSSGFRTISPILINQGLSAHNFSVKFPSGTKVSDQIAGREYTVKEETTE